MYVVLGGMALCVLACLILGLLLVFLNNQKSPTPNTTNTSTSSNEQTDDALPAWAALGQLTARNANAHFERNKKAAKAINDAQETKEFVLWGDSITGNIMSDTASKEKWDLHFKGINAEALGVGGSTVEQLVWRMMAGPENLKYPPKVLGLLIGVNNLLYRQMQYAEHLDYLLAWIRKTMPTTKIILINLLPNTRPINIVDANAKLKALAIKYGAVWCTCGALLQASNTTWFPDGLHPSAAAYDKIFQCLRPLVLRALGR